MQKLYMKEKKAAFSSMWAVSTGFLYRKKKRKEKLEKGAAY